MGNHNDKVLVMRPRDNLFAFTTILIIIGTLVVLAQRGGVFRASRDHPAIAYSSGPADNSVSRLNTRIQSGDVQLKFDEVSGYLRSLLHELDISVDSQVTVFSQTSFQAQAITSKNPRAIYFRDNIAAAWVRGGEVIEIAAHDPRQGAVFYVLDQIPVDRPRLRRNDGCLACHLSWDTLGVPGFQVLSTAPLSPDPNAYATGFVTDHRSPLVQRWGGWYVTGDVGSIAHMGNVEVTDVIDPAPPGTSPPLIQTLEEVMDVNGYLSSHSDVVALMVLDHQIHMMNLITRLGWEARRVLFRAEHDSEGTDDLVRDTATELVDYMLFVDEAPLPTKITGSSSFAAQFVGEGVSDSVGRSLRDFDLEERLFRYPCSYMIYSEAFDLLPDLAKDFVYQRMWEVLSGQENGELYTGLRFSDRQAVVEILRTTKDDLPLYFQTVTQ